MVGKEHLTRQREVVAIIYHDSGNPFARICRWIHCVATTVKRLPAGDQIG